MRRKSTSKVVTWLSDEVHDPQNLSQSFRHFKKFQFGNIIAEIGDFVLVSNADAAEPDTEAGCDAAKIIALYENSTDKCNPFRAKVQWYSRPSDLPKWCFSNMEPTNFLNNELIEDHRPFNTDILIETIFKKCTVTLKFTKDIEYLTHEPLNYICRYRLIVLSRRKVNIEPILEEERSALALLATPSKNSPVKTPKTPNSLVKRMSGVSLNEQKNWSITKNDGTKLLLRKAILTDKNEKDVTKTPNTTKVKKTPKSAKNLAKNTIEEILSMELKENSDDDLPTLIIRQHVPTTPKRKLSASKTNECSPKKSLVFDNNEDQNPYINKSVCSMKNSLNYLEHEMSPVTKTPKKKAITTPKLLLVFDNKEHKSPYTTKSGRVIKNCTNYFGQEVSPVKKISTKESVSKTNECTTPKLLTFSNDEEDKSPYITRSGRVMKNRLNYLEYEVSPVKKTPKKGSVSKTKHTPKKILVFDDKDKSPYTNKSHRGNSMELDVSPVKRRHRSVREEDSESDDDFKPVLKTPKTPKTPKTSRSVKSAQTPKRSVTRRINTNQLTPSLKMRTHSVDKVDDIGKVNKSLPGREGQLNEILSFVRTKLLDRTSGCMYISGVPGTGKTATVCSALQMLKEEVDLPNFQLVEVNGMKITEPRQAYVQIYKQLTGKSVVWEQACSLLEKRFTNPGTKRIPTVLLVDELDALCTRRQDVLYSIMEWAAHNTALLTVLAVANTMDLPERALAARVASRLGLTRLTFPPYTHTQLQKIVATRLDGANVTPDAVQLIARKVAAVSGDARRALALCARALELAGPEGAGLKEVQQALGDASSSAAVRAIKNCSPAERLMLRAVAAEVERTGSDETTLSRALNTAAAIVALDGRPYKSATSIRAPTPAQAQAICSRLAAIRLLLLEPKPSEPRLLLNVSADDVHYATRQIRV